MNQELIPHIDIAIQAIILPCPLSEKIYTSLEMQSEKLVYYLIIPEDGNSIQFNNDIDLDFSTRKEAQEEVERIIQKLKISVESSPTCYVLDYETLTQECEKYNEYMNTTFDRSLSIYSS